jgi:hypothetical protein
MYGLPTHVPLLEMQAPDTIVPSYVTEWDAASAILDKYSYVNHPQSQGGRETAAWVSEIVGGVHAPGAASGTWTNLNYYQNPATGHTALGTDGRVPLGFQLWKSIGQVRSSSGDGYATPVYRHQSHDDIYRVTTSATPPPGYSLDVLLGYMKGDPGVTMDQTLRPLDDGASYQMISISTGKPIGTSQKSTSNGTTVVNNPTSRSAGPWWRFVAAGDGSYRVLDAEADRALDLVGNSTSDGVKAIVWSYVGQTDQEWRVEASGSGYRLVARHSGKCLHVPSSTTGVQLVQSTCNGGTNQQFRLLKKAHVFPSSGFFKLIARHSSKAVGVKGSSTLNAGIVEQWASGSGSNQRWRLTQVAGNLVALTAKHSQRNMQIAGMSKSNGASVEQWSPMTGTTNQQWRFNLNAEGFFEVVNENSIKCLDVVGSSTSDGARLQQTTCSKAKNQQFDLVRVE